jgi:hypothetical protein
LAESPEGESGSPACYARLPRRCRGVQKHEQPGQTENIPVT